jgi:SAM-dependent methyltransferase
MGFNIEKSNKLFKKMLDFFGPDNAEALHWKNQDSQFLRYDIFSTIGDLNNASILDIGAGLGDFYGYLTGKGYRNFEYLGVDVLEDFVEQATRKFPDAEFECGDLLTYNPGKKYDYVICCGALNVVIGDMEKLVRKAINHLYSMCRKGFGFNLLSKHAYFKDKSLYNYDPIDIIKYCSKHTPYIQYRHDYLDNDFTIFMYKNQRYRV